LAVLTSASLESAGILAFTMQYLQVMKLFAKIWEHVVWKIRSDETGGLEYLFGKLDVRLRELRYRYIGFSKEEELYVLELIVVACMLRLSKVEICCSPTTLKKLSAIISHIEILNDKGPMEPSNILMDAKKTVHEIESSKAGISCSLFLITNLVDFFTLKQFSLCPRVRHINAELDVPGNDSENPLPFVSGLPVAIPLDITLYNVSSENRLWLTIRMSQESTQFVFLDSNILGGCNEVKKFTFMAPFYRTPKARSFSSWISIGMECALEDCHLVKHCGGPKRKLVYLCQEKEVHLCLVRRD
jgi:integrator complex subunit 4